MKTQAHSLDSFIQRTKALHKSLEKLIKQYPEGSLQPDDKIFNRILTNDWRNFTNFVGPIEKRYVDASEWVRALRSYHSDLCDFCSYSMGEPGKLEELPMNPGLGLSASRCLDSLELQFQVLTRWKSEVKVSPSADPLARLRRELQALIETKGIKIVAVEAKLARDTVEDFANGKTKVQENTLRKLKEYVKQ